MVSANVAHDDGRSAVSVWLTGAVGPRSASAAGFCHLVGGKFVFTFLFLPSVLSCSGARDEVPSPCASRLGYRTVCLHAPLTPTPLSHPLCSGLCLFQSWGYRTKSQSTRSVDSHPVSHPLCSALCLFPAFVETDHLHLSLCLPAYLCVCSAFPCLCRDYPPPPHVSACLSICILYSP